MKQKKTFEKEEVIREIVNKTNQINIDYENYVDKFMRIANIELYMILSNIMKLDEEITSSGLGNLIVKEMRNHLRVKKSINVNAKSSQLLVLTRMIVQSDKKKATIYSQVIQNAKNKNISSDQLVDYIQLRGGIEKAKKLESIQCSNEQKLINYKKFYDSITYKMSNSDGLGIVNLNCNEKIHKTSASNVQYIYFACKKLNGNQFKVVGSLYHNELVEEQFICTHRMMLEAVKLSNDNVKFNEFIKKHKINFDLLDTWQVINNIMTEEDAINALKLVDFKNTEFNSKHIKLIDSENQNIVIS
jgi:hypothetical protein